MTNDDWLSVFRDIGSTLRSELPSIMGAEGGLTPLGRGAGGDKTFPVDKWAEDIIITVLERIHRAGESFTLISEELGVRNFGESDLRLLVDPIDGSNNAKTGVPFFSTSLALIKGETLAGLQAGYVLNIAAGDEFWALKEKGAYKNQKKIRSAPSEDIAIIAYEASTPKSDIPRLLPLLQAARRARCFGSLALDLAYLAAGAFNVFAAGSRSRAFDFAAGMLLLKEAGGMMTDLDGNSLDSIPAGLERTVPLLACANEQVHRKALHLLSEAGQR